jgi:hypothetical protein
MFALEACKPAVDCTEFANSDERFAGQEVRCRIVRIGG